MVVATKRDSLSKDFELFKKTVVLSERLRILKDAPFTIRHTSTDAETNV